jgi:hypothetical protein
VGPVDLFQLTRQILDSFHPAAEAKEITLESSEPKIVMKGGPTRLKQVIWNLISNALKSAIRGRRWPGGGYRRADVRDPFDSERAPIAIDDARLETQRNHLSASSDDVEVVHRDRGIFKGLSGDHGAGHFQLIGNNDIADVHPDDAPGAVSRHPLTFLVERCEVACKIVRVNRGARIAVRDIRFVCHVDSPAKSLAQHAFSRRQAVIISSYSIASVN